MALTLLVGAVLIGVTCIICGLFADNIGEFVQKIINWLSQK